MDSSTFIDAVHPYRCCWRHTAGLPPEKVDDYVLEMREKAWSVFPYPCIGQFRFLHLSLHHQASYAQVLARLKAGQGAVKYLDVGCCIVQDLRSLVADGAPSEALYGAELQRGFIDLGYEFFRDRKTLKAIFMQADIVKLDEAGSPLKEMQGTFQFIHLGMVLHIFDWDRQRQALQNCVRMLKPEPGVLIIGTTVGSEEGEAAGTAFRHNAATFERMWTEIGQGLGVPSECKASVDGGLGVDTGKCG